MGELDTRLVVAALAFIVGALVGVGVLRIARRISHVAIRTALRMEGPRGEVLRSQLRQHLDHFDHGLKLYFAADLNALMLKHPDMTDAIFEFIPVSMVPLLFEDGLEDEPKTIGEKLDELDGDLAAYVKVEEDVDARNTHFALGEAKSYWASHCDAISKNGPTAQKESA